MVITTEEALEKIRNVHGDKYRLDPEWEYKNAKSDIRLYCPEHGEFHKDFYRLVNMKQGCPVCSHNGKVYKPAGYYNIKENSEELVKTCRSKAELQKKSSTCYKACVNNGWLDEFSEKYFDGSIMYMGYLEKRNTVYVYEFPDEKVFYVGRTNNLRRRDKQHRYGWQHSGGSWETDGLYKFCEENSKEMPQPRILEIELTAPESQEREDYWKNRYIADGWTTLNKAVTGSGKGSLGATLRWDYEACREEAKKYPSKNAMKIGNQSAYKSARNNGWIDEFFINKNKPSGYWDIFENVQKAASECSGSKELTKKFGGAYNSARKNGWVSKLVYGKKKK